MLIYFEIKLLLFENDKILMLFLLEKKLYLDYMVLHDSIYITTLEKLGFSSIIINMYTNWKCRYFPLCRHLKEIC